MDNAWWACRAVTENHNLTDPARIAVVIVSTIPGVKPGRVVVFGVPDEAEGTELIAVVVEVDTDDPEKKAETGRLIRRGFDPASILCLTFTRRAAAEMRLRVHRELLASPDDIEAGVAAAGAVGAIGGNMAAEAVELR
jgi:hypothetical protein